MGQANSYSLASPLEGAAPIQTSPLTKTTTKAKTYLLRVVVGLSS